MSLTRPMTTPPNPSTTPHPTIVPTPCVPSAVTSVVCLPVQDKVERTTPTTPEQTYPSGRGHPGPRGLSRGCRGCGRYSVGQQSQATEGVMGQVLTKIQERKQLQKDLNHQLENHNSNMGSLIRVLQDIYTHLCRVCPALSTSSCGLTI